MMVSLQNVALLIVCALPVTRSAFITTSVPSPTVASLALALPKQQQQSSSVRIYNRGGKGLFMTSKRVTMMMSATAVDADEENNNEPDLIMLKRLKFHLSVLAW
jgi:hypothetical protein